MAATQIIALLLRNGIGALFVYSGVMKLLDLPAFALAVQHYELTSWSASVVIATYLPWLEIVSGGALLLRRAESGALLVLAALCVVFLVAISSAWARGLDISCGCFGKESGSIRTNFPRLVAQDILLLASIGFLLVTHRRHAPDFSR